MTLSLYQLSYLVPLLKLSYINIITTSTPQRNEESLALLGSQFGEVSGDV